MSRPLPYPNVSAKRRSFLGRNKTADALLLSKAGRFGTTLESKPTHFGECGGMESVKTEPCVPSKRVKPCSVAGRSLLRHSDCDVPGLIR
jgi:hypothetical protein